MFHFSYVFYILNLCKCTYLSGGFSFLICYFWLCKLFNKHIVIKPILPDFSPILNSNYKILRIKSGNLLCKVATSNHLQYYIFLGMVVHKNFCSTKIRTDSVEYILGDRRKSSLAKLRSSLTMIYLNCINHIQLGLC